MPAPSTPPFLSALWTGSFRGSSLRRTYKIGRGLSRNQAVKGGMYHSGMPSSARYRALLVAELPSAGFREQRLQAPFPAGSIAGCLSLAKVTGYGRSMSITIAAEIGAVRRLKIRLTPWS